MTENTGNTIDNPAQSVTVERFNRSNRGTLRNGNPSGDPRNAPRCGAKARTRDGAPCRNAAMKNGRCRMHGGMSTGPRTPEGRERIRRANTRHGRYSQAAKQEAREMRTLLRQVRAGNGELEQMLKTTGYLPKGGNPARIKVSVS